MASRPPACISSQQRRASEMARLPNLDTRTDKNGATIQRSIGTTIIVNTPITVLLHPNYGRSYAVPKKVGKVGTESPTFIEPIAIRRDGMKAMFSKQDSSPATPRKHKLDDSPSPSSVNANKVKAHPVNGSSHQRKHPKLDDTVSIPASCKRVCRASLTHVCIG